MFPIRFLRGMACAALLVAAAPAGAEKVRMHFDADSAGRPPGFFDFVVWGAPGTAEWLVLGDMNPPSTPNKVIQTIDTRPAGSLAVALRRKYAFQDGDISVGVRRGSGRGGIVFRAAGEKNFLLLLLDVASGEARLTSWRDGKETELARGKATVDHDWGTLSVTASGPTLAAQWNGKLLLTATDPHPAAGRVGLATAGAGQTSFDELVFDAAPSP
ncbi:MAG TPA: hypothetical protein VGS98_05710 [Thermoanaerobaculia bacterium]|nr:hypothetical protein [Thermoanaerobaculia bacterium]